MWAQGLSWVRLSATLAAAGGMFMCGQMLPFEPARDSGQSITGAFEGWFRNPDGSFGLLLGYYNRNRKQELDIPVGPNNRIEPDGPDRGQPTHFLVGRQWGIFTVKVPGNPDDHANDPTRCPDTGDHACDRYGTCMEASHVRLEGMKWFGSAGLDQASAAG